MPKMMERTAILMKLLCAILMLIGISVGLFFMLMSFGSPLYALFIPFIFLIYFPISWGCTTELDVEKETQSWPAIARFFWGIPLTLYKNVFCFPGFFICKAFRDATNLKKQNGEASNKIRIRSDSTEGSGRF